MEKNEVISYMVMESPSEPMKPQKLQVKDEHGLCYVKFETFLQEFNAKNRNKRIYSSGAMMESLAAPHIQELLKKGRMCGEAGHPDSDKPQRVMTIDPKVLSHRINWMRLEGNMLRAEVESLDDGMYGTQFTRHILQGMEPSFSLRALAALTKMADGTALVQSKCHVVTYDSVILPSHEKAYRDESKAIQRVNKSMSTMAPTVVHESGLLLPVHESTILDFIKEESSNVKLISNICEIALENMTLTADGRNVIIKESGGRTFFVKTEDRIKHDVRKFMSNLS